MKPVACMVVVVFASTCLADSTKLWVSDFAAYINQNPQTSCIVGRSQQPALTSDEAERFARRDAAEQLIPMLQARLNSPVDPARIRAMLESSLAQPGWIFDRFVETKERTYGTIWSEAILVDSSPKRLDDLARRLQAATRNQEERNAAVFAGSAVLLVLMSFVYLALNWFTRGYFRARLAVFAILIIVGGIAMLRHLI